MIAKRFVFVSATFVFGAFSFSAIGDTPESTQPHQTKIKELKQERVEVLRKAVETARVLFQADRQHERVWEAERELVEAQLDIADSLPLKLQIAEHYHSRTQEFESQMKQQVEHGVSNNHHYLKAINNRILAEITLEEVKLESP